MAPGAETLTGDIRDTSLSLPLTALAP